MCFGVILSRPNMLPIKGVNACGILTGLEFAKTLSPVVITNPCISVPNASPAAATVPSAVMKSPPLAVLTFVKPLSSNQSLTFEISCGLAPKRSPNSSEVSHCWYRVDVLSIWSSRSLSSSATCSRVRLRKIVTPIRGWFRSTRPRSAASFNSGRMLLAS